VSAKIPTDVTLNVLGYQEDGEWVALALEMDLRGYGQTFTQAQEELDSLIEAQFSFAAKKGQPELIWHKAEPKYWRRFYDAKRAWIQDALLGHRKPAGGYRVAGVPVPKPHIASEFSKGRLLEA
jgi:hypothetical protein